MHSVDDPRPGFKWPVTVTQSIDAPAQQIWQAISMPGNLEYCHPFCKSNPVSVWPGPDSRDEVHYLNGLIYHREFCNWIEGTGYDLEIGTRLGARSYVSWRIATIDDRASSLRITVYPHALQQIPVAVRWLPYLLTMRPRLRQYLLSVVKGFEWYLVRNEPVPRNQWGAHPWFSAPP